MVALKEWPSNTWIRSKVHGIDCEREEGVYFKPELVPVSVHPLVKEKPKEIASNLQILHLLHYLDGVDTLETEIINVSLQNIYRNKIPVQLSKEMYTDAYKIYVDEGFHAFMSYEFKESIIEQNQVNSFESFAMNTTHEINAIVASAPKDLHSLAQLFASSINETLISANLLQCNDLCLKPSLSAYLRSHLVDEAKHHVYFSELFQHIWSKLLVDEKKVLGVLFPTFVKSLLSRNQEAILSSLVSQGFDAGQAEQILEESYDPHKEICGLNEAAKGTLKLFNHSGVFKVSEIRDAFRASGFDIPEN